MHPSKKRNIVIISFFLIVVLLFCKRPSNKIVSNVDIAGKISSKVQAELKATPRPKTNIYKEFLDRETVALGSFQDEFLNQNGQSSTSLAAAYLLTRDPKLLNRLKEMAETDMQSFLQWMLCSFDLDLPEKEKLELFDKLLKNLPNDPSVRFLASLYSIRDENAQTMGKSLSPVQLPWNDKERRKLMRDFLALGGIEQKMQYFVSFGADLNSNMCKEMQIVHLGPIVRQIKTTQDSALRVELANQVLGTLDVWNSQQEFGLRSRHNYYLESSTLKLLGDPNYETAVSDLDRRQAAGLEFGKRLESSLSSSSTAKFEDLANALMILEDKGISEAVKSLPIK